MANSFEAQMAGETRAMALMPAIPKFYQNNN
jgi:hypothetical protein